MSTASHVSRKQAFANQVVEQMAAFAPVQAKPMFGGFGIYRDGLMFALITQEQLYFKADDQTEPVFTREGLNPFTYESKGKTARLRYYEAHAEVFDDPQRMAWWARLAYDCAVRNRPAARKAAKLPDKKPTSRSQAEGRSAAGLARLEALPNLGPKFAEMLVRAGIRSESALRKAGAVKAFVQVRGAMPEATLQLLWALEGALSGRPAQEIDESDRTSLLMALEDATRHQPGRPDR
ncbi:MAG TPA: TfoX/Sxy family DNA transformation protein [Candidatus Aquabacterium excrementipullorum]|nr:TfoX/Sxy family DNA transformation protein [Candidatus Aquabacterium excrementipullorum]